jgi:hypothetical protein
VPPGALATVQPSASLNTASSFDLYPNPVTDRVLLSLSNDYTGSLDVQVVDMSGVVKKDFPLTKAATGAMQTYLTLSDLPAGNYIVKAAMQQWSQSKQIVKQ